MKNQLFILLLFCNCIVFGQSEKVIITKLNSIQTQAQIFVGLDGLGAYYFINDNVFFKSKNNVVSEYKNLSLGKISKVDIVNPLQLILFYENFNTSILLDNQLNETQKINFSENGVSINATAIGLSAQNQLWVYNSLNQQMGLFDYLKNSYKSISLPISEKIKYYQSDFNTFTWIDEKYNWYSCDIYGKIAVVGKAPDFEIMQFISNSEIIFKKKNALYYYSLKDNKTTVIDFNEKTFENFYYKDQILAIFTPNTITNYKIKIP